MMEALVAADSSRSVVPSFVRSCRCTCAWYWYDLVPVPSSTSRHMLYTVYTEVMGSLAALLPLTPTPRSRPK